jgi:hypothetical protein
MTETEELIDFFLKISMKNVNKHEIDFGELL